MAALTGPRTTPEIVGDHREGGAAAAALIYAGALVMRNAAGTLVKATAALNLVGVGRASETVDNSAGGAGAKRVKYQMGIFRFANSTAGDLITDVDVGALCYAVDDQTVAKTNGGNTRSRAGVVEMVDAQGVWVRLDEALTKAA